MPLKFVRVAVVRTEKVHTGGGDYDEAEVPVPGSPFLLRVYRDTQKVFDRDEAASGNASVDRMQRVSSRDPNCPIREGDIVLLPRPGGRIMRASVLLARPYADRVQYDLETGAEGDLPPAIPALIAEGSSTEAVFTPDPQPPILQTPILGGLTAEQSSNEVMG